MFMFPNPVGEILKFFPLAKVLDSSIILITDFHDDSLQFKMIRKLKYWKK